MACTARQQYRREKNVRRYALEKALLASVLSTAAAALSSAETSIESAWSWGEGGRDETDDGGVEIGELRGEELSDMVEALGSILPDFFKNGKNQS